MYSGITLEFTPLEFETNSFFDKKESVDIRIYSVGVWNNNADEVQIHQNDD